MEKSDSLDEDDLEIIVLPDGKLQFCRYKQPIVNEALFNLLREILGSEVNSLKEFFDCSEKMKLLFGDEFYCG